MMQGELLLRVFLSAYYLTISHVTDLDITLHRKISNNLRIQRSDVSLCIAIICLEEQTSGNYGIYSIPIVSSRGQHKFVPTNGQLQLARYVILPFLFNPVNKQLDIINPYLQKSNKPSQDNIDLVWFDY